MKNQFSINNLCPSQFNPIPTLQPLELKVLLHVQRVVLSKVRSCLSEANKSPALSDHDYDRDNVPLSPPDQLRYTT